MLITMQIMENEEKMLKEISIAGIPINLDEIGWDKLKGLSLDIILGFRFYCAEINKHRLSLVENADVTRAYTPMQYVRIANQVERILEIPVEFLLQAVPFYIRQRLIEQGVYFVVSDRYVFLPGMLINERI